MSSSVFDKETILDLTVNIVPLFILAFFIGAFVLFNPWSGSLLERSLQFVLVGSMFVGLAVLTYMAAKAIEGDAVEGEH